MASTTIGVTTPGAVPFTIRSILGPLIAIILGLFMVILDTTAVNVALPALVTDFKTNLSSLQWIITGYLLAQAAVIPLAGWLSDRYGAKNVFLAAVTLFTIGSALCATAQNGGMLIAFRILQGLGGGFVMPVGMAYTYRLSPPEKRGAVMGTMGIPILFAPAIGPSLAGWLVQYASWQWIFLINVPVGIIALAIGARRLPVVDRQVVPALDLAGMILGPLSFVLLSYGVSEGSSSWTSTNTLGGLIGGAVALIVFIVVELRVRQPLLELRVFRSLDFNLAIAAQWVGQVSLFGGMFLVPLFLQQVRGYGAFDTGLTLLAQALAAMIFMPIGGRLFDRIGARPLVVSGLALVGIGTFWLAHLTATTSGTDLTGPLILRGAGMGLMMMALNTHLLNTAPRHLVGRVTSLTSALQSVVNSLAVAGLSTILTARPSYHKAQAQIAALKAQAAAHAHPGQKAPVPAHLPAPIANLFASAFNDTLYVVLILAIVGIALGFTLRRNLAAQTADAPAGTQAHVQEAALEALAG